ncbi:MAG: energy transducer TonB [Hyphomonadaceae bacterium JAD_PAG50586_4]|nr:MAG: energy transducer TonB [Hyphomonadaceae bacterium JAD_PAG50586_4]
MRRLLFLAVLFAATTAFGDTRVEEPEPIDIQNARFLQQPSGQDFAENYPPHATAQGVQGLATIECLVELDTSLHCRVTAEAPTGWGFGQAALEISRAFRVAPATVNGVPTRGGRIRRTIRFVLPETYVGGDWSDLERQVRALNPPLDLPSWDDAPDFYAVLDAYPAVARGNRVSGRALLSCVVREDRRLNCQNRNERPAGLGFGAAAIPLSTQFRVATNYEDFIARHREEPFLLPIIFSDEMQRVPTDRYFSGQQPLRIPPVTIGLRDITPGARASTRQGKVIALCTAQEATPLACVIEQETPVDNGLGDYALDILSTATIEASPIFPGDQVRFEFNFDLP